MMESLKKTLLAVPKKVRSEGRGSLKPDDDSIKKPVHLFFNNTLAFVFIDSIDSLQSNISVFCNYFSLYFLVACQMMICTQSDVHPWIIKITNTSYGCLLHLHYVVMLMSI